MSLKGQQCHLATFNLYPLNSMLLRCYLTLEQVPGVAHCTRLVVLVTKAKYVQIQWGQHFLTSFERPLDISWSLHNVVFHIVLD